MLNVAPVGYAVLKGRFTRTPKYGAPLSRRASLQEISPLASGLTSGDAGTRRSVEMTRGS